MGRGCTLNLDRDAAVAEKYGYHHRGHRISRHGPTKETFFIDRILQPILDKGPGEEKLQGEELEKFQKEKYFFIRYAIYIDIALVAALAGFIYWRFVYKRR